MQETDKLQKERETNQTLKLLKIRELLDSVQKNYSMLIFNAQEKEMHHNSYAQEVREQTAIELGNMEMLKSALAEDFGGQLGIVSKDDPLRNMKDISIAVITLASRSAIRGGLLPEISFSYSDIYINQVEKASTAEETILLARSAEFQYTEMVHELQEKKDEKEARNYSLHINRCRNYIFSHLHQKLTVKEIADNLGLSADYLSNIFKKYEAVTISQYIIHEKIKLVKNMLIYSHYSYSQIAAYFGFSSQSHLGSLFKKETGYTLGEYRKIYGAGDF